ncbi:hypothetical protein NDU88_002849 [Pleurodeles waltl]|uniref:Uncharacterized protein n=1 Tax=Pleurodeles waltl TaxID=8319 RepID=A0AAV7T4U0_PLEWA|nr:hypothetical protein NDU88_002849 [Pleurodeles waltl]
MGPRASNPRLCVSLTDESANKKTEINIRSFLLTVPEGAAVLAHTGNNSKGDLTFGHVYIFSDSRGLGDQTRAVMRV